MATKRSAPEPIDRRGPRLNQGAVSALMLVGFLLDWWPLAPITGAILFVGAALGPRYGPFLRLYADLIKPRLGPPAELEDPRAPRFAAALGVVLLASATVSFAAGAASVGWAFSLLFSTIAGVASVAGLCLGCEVWFFLARRRGVALSVGA